MKVQRKMPVRGALLHFGDFGGCSDRWVESKSACSFRRPSFAIRFGVVESGGNAWSLSENTKSACFITLLWQAMQPVKMVFCSNVSNATLANAVVAPVPGNVLAGMPGKAGLLAVVGHCVMTSW